MPSPDENKLHMQQRLKLIRDQQRQRRKSRYEGLPLSFSELGYIKTSGRGELRSLTGLFFETSESVSREEGSWISSRR